MTEHTISWLAKSAGVPVSTVRHYERKRLLAQPERRPSGYRRYQDEDLLQLQLVLRAKQLRFTLPEIVELFGGGENRTAANIVAAAQRKQAVLRADVDRLTRAIGRLEQLVSVCTLGDSGRCEILEFGPASTDAEGGSGEP